MFLFIKILHRSKVEAALKTTAICDFVFSSPKSGKNDPYERVAYYKAISVASSLSSGLFNSQLHIRSDNIAMMLQDCFEKLSPLRRV